MSENTEAQMWEATATDYLRLLLPLFTSDERALFEGTGELPSRDLSDARAIEAQVREQVAREIGEACVVAANDPLMTEWERGPIVHALADAARIARGNA